MMHLNIILSQTKTVSRYFLFQERQQFKLHILSVILQDEIKYYPTSKYYACYIYTEIGLVLLILLVSINPSFRNIIS